MMAAAAGAAAPAPVLLGIAGDYTDTEPVDHFATKVGGKPHFPAAEPPSHAGAITCQACGKGLSLVLQAYAPLEVGGGVTQPVAERNLYLYGCTTPGCGQAPGSWRAFRCQRAPAAAAEQSPQRGQEGSSAASGAAAGQSSGAQAAAADAGGFGDAGAGFGAKGFGDAGWGFGDGGFGDAGGFGDNAGALGDFQDLDAALEAAAKSTQAAAKSGASGPAKHKTEQAGAKQEGAAAAGASASYVTCTGPCPGPILPEFYIQAVEEPGGGKKGLSRAELDHIQQLLQQYEQEEAVGGGKGGGAGAASAAAAGGEAGGSGQGPAGPSDDESFAPEEYEEGEVRGVDAKYLKFNERLQLQADQCVRYCRGGLPLWPTGEAPSAGPCAHCGGPRVFEMQLMAPVISLIMEATEYLSLSAGGAEQQEAEEGAAAGGPQHDAMSTVSGSAMTTSSAAGYAAKQGAQLADPAAINGAANWDICTVAVYSCRGSCVQGGQVDPASGVVWVEEQVALVNETECHVAIEM